MGDTSMGFWGAAITEHIYEFFKKIKLQNYRNFLDLGSGDGKVVLIASLFGVKATGIEIDDDLIKTSERIKKELKLKADFIKGDFFKHDFSKYDIIFINPDKGFENGLEDKLLKELNGKLSVYNQIFLPRFLRKGRSYWFDQVPVIIYRR